MLVAALRAQQDQIRSDSWDGNTGSGSGTESMRQALLTYQSLFEPHRRPVTRSGAMGDFISAGEFDGLSARANAFGLVLGRPNSAIGVVRG